MSAAESTVRVRAATRDKLRSFAAADGRSIPDELDELVAREEGRRMLDQHNAAMDRLQAHPEGSSEWADEKSAWEATLMDGLRDL